jgi:hypothetical protein
MTSLVATQASGSPLFGSLPTCRLRNTSGWDRSLNQGQFRSFEEGHPQSVVSFVSFKSAPAKPSCSLSPSFGAHSLFIRFACGQSHMSRRGTHLGRLYLRPGKRMLNSPKSTPLLQPWSWTIAPVVECEARMSFQRRQAPYRACPLRSRIHDPDPRAANLKWMTPPPGP